MPKKKQLAMMRLAPLLVSGLMCIGMTNASEGVMGMTNALEGVEVPESRIVNGTILPLNGAGIRSFSFFGMSLKVYVATFYTRSPLRNWEAVQACKGPKHFDFTFLRGVGQGQVTQAWQRQLDASVSHTYDGYENDRDAFVRMFGPIKSGGMTTIQLLEEDTVVVDQGTHKGVIQGRNFQRAFLSMWFGERAVQADLKAGLLGSGAPEMAMAVV
jgi:hypothetical protein